MTVEERKEVALKDLRDNELTAKVALANPFDKFLLWAAWAAEDAVFKTVDILDPEDSGWLDAFLKKSRVKCGGLDKRHAPERNPLVKEICRQVYDELSEGAA